MNFNKFLFQDYDSLHEYIQLVDKAKTIDIDSGNEKIDLAYALYLKASYAHLAYAERRLGSMTIEGNGTERNFNKGVGFYLMAAEDGDLYSRAMLGIAPGIDVSVLDKARSGDISAITDLVNIYFEYGRHYNRAKEWCVKGIYKGHISCALLLCELLFEEDNALYLKHPSYSDLYYQDEEWIYWANKYMQSENIYNEVLVVNSKERIKTIFDIFKYIIINHHDDTDLLKAVMHLFIVIINTANSYHRSHITINQDIVHTHFVQENDIFSDDWISRTVSMTQTQTRGYYLHNSNIINNFYREDSSCYAITQGTNANVYSSQFTLQDKRIVGAYCNCKAFEKYNGMCKHIVAMFYRMQEELNGYRTYKNTAFPEYTSVTGSSIIKKFDNVFIYYKDDRATEKYIEFLHKISSFLIDKNNENAIRFIKDSHELIYISSEKKEQIGIAIIPYANNRVDSQKDGIAINMIKNYFGE